MIRPPPRSTRTDTLFPYTTLFRALIVLRGVLGRDTDIDARPADRLGRGNVEIRLLERGDGRIHREQLAHVVIVDDQRHNDLRSEEHTSELQSLMSISYAVFCLKKKKRKKTNPRQHTEQTQKK